MSPTEEQLVELIAAFVARDVAGGSEVQDYTHPDYFSMDEVVGLANWRRDNASRVIFVLDPETELMRLWATTEDEEEALGEEIRRELDAQAASPDSHRFLVMYTRPQAGPREGQVHYGSWVEETFDRDGADVYEMAVYDSENGPRAEGSRLAPDPAPELEAA